MSTAVSRSSVLVGFRNVGENQHCVGRVADVTEQMCW